MQYKGKRFLVHPRIILGEKVTKKLAIAIAILLTATRIASANYLTDIGVTPGSDWVPDFADIVYVVEDSVGIGPTGYGGYVGPGYGGQAFDAEALYTGIDNGYLKFAVVTGTKPTPNGWYPGDLAIDIGNDGVYEYGVETTGLTHGYGSALPAPSVAAGNLYDVTAWGKGLQNWGDGLGNQGYLSFPTEILAIDGSSLGAVNDFLYVLNNTNGGDHYLIQGAIPLAGLTGWNGAYTLHWTQTCGNDAISVQAAPEPASLGLLALGCLGLATLRKRRTA